MQSVSPTVLHIKVENLYTQTVVIDIPYLFNPSQFYASKQLHPSQYLCGYYEYNLQSTQLFIDKYQNICDQLLVAITDKYVAAFSCDSNNLYFTLQAAKGARNPRPRGAVSYTHLTLPTKRIV